MRLGNPRRLCGFRNTLGWALKGVSNKKAAVFLSFGDGLPVDLSLCAPALSLALGWVLGTQIRCILVRYGKLFFFNGRHFKRTKEKFITQLGGVVERWF